MIEEKTSEKTAGSSAIKRIALFLPALVIMVMIFCFSAQPSDDSEIVSGMAGYRLFEAANSIFGFGWSTGELLNLSHEAQHTIRKIAHFTEYMFLGAAILFGFAGNARLSGLGFSLKPPKLSALSLVIAAGYAASDELHQRFVPGRAGRVSDVLIDSAGALTGVVIFSLILFLAARRAEAGRE